MTAPLAQRADSAVAHVIATTADEESLYSGVLAAVGDALGCQFGAVWEAEGDELACVETWCAPGFPGDDFASVTRSYRFGPGDGLPGRVWASGEAAWVVDVADDRNFPRAEPATAAGLTTALCFPLGSARGVVGVIEIYSAEPRIPDSDLLETMGAVGVQIGQALVRRRSDRSIRESEERKRAILQAALDCVITIDHHGHVVEWGGAAEETFGYSAEEVVGREMAELIVPPSLRERHRKGFGVRVEHDRGSILGHRVEITGMRADGSEFPVELAITRINLPGPPMFTGYLRDITERKRAEAELRASRARIVEAADDERRRIERDLHDGAQQRLVHVALMLRLARTRLEADPRAGAEAVDEILVELAAATAELRELARGIHPAVLSDGGLAPALTALAERSQPRAKVVSVPHGRLPARVESTAYFVVAEALTNATRYAQASSATVSAVVDDGRLVVEVCDDGGGGADGNGSGLRGLADRAAAMDGKLEVVSGEGEGTMVRVSLPCA
ncbi:MAG TPA: PAS domain S-box protein [Thermoleophilaceae bacterium]|nr:PAS domain S-box protein [Thermoleophilaceae bacterium]